ncbi:MAG: lasso peptide biosynthesis B2 protein [Egibacteraceae bacterium]
MAAPAERLTTVRVLFTACSVEIAIRALPIPRFVRLLGVTLATDEGGIPPEPATAPALSTFDPIERRRIRAVLRVMRRWPFGRGSCLRQALLLGHFLRARHPVLHLGVAGRGEEMAAHAWIAVSGVTIGGLEGFLPLIGRAGGDEAG